MNEDIQISTDKNKLDIAFIHQYLSTNTYWAKGRSLETVRTSIEHSLCFGVFHKTELIGFARVVTDYSVFAWILDVFIIEAFQGKGFGKQLMKHIMDHPDLANLQRWGLNTYDAHGLYEQYGFHELERPDIYMEITHPPS